MAKRSNRLKEEMLELLETDKEFRYAVAGYLGISEIMKRLDSHEEKMAQILDEVKKLWEEVKGLRESQEKIWEEIRALRKGQEKLWREVKHIRVTTDRLALSLEEEPRSFIAHRLKQELGIDMKLDRVFVDSEEIDIYGATGDICIIGEATTRLGPKRVQRLIRRIELIKQRRPELLRKKIIKAIYTYVAVPQALEVAINNKVWVLDWQRNLTPIAIEETG
ncbi:MAG: septation ring formation regulator EzrA [Thermofilum sp.]|nr:septation ring formation regulator EzrA [Thermofilum sp.]